jgi:putative ABC transport system permease protein
VLLVPVLTVRILRLAPRSGRVVPDTALAQLKDNIGFSTLSLASIIVSFSLMVAMAIMVYSFRVSFDHWLGKLLPADLQLREPLGNDTAYWSPGEQAAVAAIRGVARAEFRRTRPLLMDPSRPAVTLIARRETPANAAAELPLIRSLPVGPLGAAGRGPGRGHGAAAPAATPVAAPAATPVAAPAATPVAAPAWISEAMQDLYGYRLGDPIDLPLGGRKQRFTVQGVWRDYARTFGAVVITRSDYIAATGDHNANEGSLWLDAGTTAAAAEAALRAALGGAPEILTSTALREKSLNIFDRAFAITYSLEVIAVLIGLMGVSFAASSTALARRAEFGMLRHLGMLRRQVIGMLASEGVLMSIFGVAYGLALGMGLSLVLVFVVNRQSFNWSIDLAVPVWQLMLLSATLIAAAAVTAVWSGRAAMSQEAVCAVREDW